MTSPRLACAALMLVASVAATAAESTLDPVVVTAQRRQQPIDEVPLSVSRIGGEVLERDAITDISGLASRVPGLAANAGGIPSLYLRGIGSNDLGAGGDPSVGVYQDGLYLGRSTGSIFDLLDVERVEVIRGPQGVLFGRNSAGGAINVVTRPLEDTRSLRLSAQAGSFGETRFTGVANLPVAPDLALRVAASTLDRDGFIYNAFSGERISDAGQRAVRATLAYQPGDSFSLQLQLGAEDKDADGTTSRSTNQDYLAGTPFDPYYSDLDHGFEQRELRYANLRSHSRFGDWQLELATAYRSIHYEDLVDSVGAGLYARRLYAGTDETNRQFSQELILQRDSDRYHLIAGASYYRQRARQLSHLESTSDTVNFAVSRQLGFPVVVIAPGRFHEENNLNGGLTQSVSAFADLTTQLADRWDLVAGLRYSRDSKDHHVDGQGSNNGLAVVFPDTPDTPASSHWTDWTPRVGINFRVNADALLYLQYAEGYKSGGFNSFVPATPFAPEHIDQVELGYKWSSADDRYAARVAAFDYRYRDLQVSVIEGGRAVLRNAARATGRGMDVDLSARLGEHYSAAIVAGWLDAEFTEFLTGNTAVDLAGNALTYSPDFQMSASLGSDHVVGSFRLAGALTWSYSGRQYFDVSNSVAASEVDVHLVDASVSVSPRDSRRWRVTLFGRNLTNSHCVTTIGGIAKDTLDAPASKRGMPRTVGVRVDLAFE
jgi:iron complex outermembrane receptor protein